jgi:hypothetical protein
MQAYAALTQYVHDVDIIPRHSIGIEVVFVFLLILFFLDRFSGNFTHNVPLC